MNNPKVAIIGAGCSGITAIKALKEAGITNIRCFEQNDQVGGNWIYSSKNSHSSICKTTHIISSKRLSEYSDFPMPDDYPDYPSHKQVLRYFHDYADAFDLNQFIDFKTKVKSAILLDSGKWAIETDKEREEFDFLLISNGHHSVPRMPDLPGKFSGELIHSHHFKNNEPFKEKKVLVIGGGNSACDCVVECSRIAERAVISMRRPHYIIPKFFLGKPADTFNKGMLWIPEFIAGSLRKLSLRIQVGNYESYGLRNPDFPVTKDHPTLNSELLYKLRHGNVVPKPGIQKIEDNKVNFIDGTFEYFDVIIAATGYKIATPFIDSAFLDYSDADEVPLYLRMFHQKYRNLIFIGLLQPQGAVWPLSEVQSVLAAKYISGKYTLPKNVEKEIRKECEDINKKFLRKKRHTIEVHYYDYLQKIHRLIRRIN